MTNYKKHIKWLAILVIPFILQMCFAISKITQPESVYVGAEFSTKLNVDYFYEGNGSPHGGKVVQVAVLAPVDWDVRNQANVRYTCDDLGVSDQQLKVVPDYEMYPYSDDENNDPNWNGMTWLEVIEAKYGLGDNTEQVEWVLFRATSSIDLSANVSGVVDIDFKTSDRAVNVNLGYLVFSESGFISNSFPGADDTDKEPCKFAPIAVITPSFNLLTPKFTYDDYFKINFITEASNTSTELAGETNIYVQGTAVLQDGSILELTERNAKTLLVVDSETSFSKYLYLKSLFGLDNTSTVTDLYLYFSNEDRSKVHSPKGGEYPGYRVMENCE
ncbi:MAG: DUF4961 domain-containing protein [Bacteroidales bacterium]